MSQTTVGPHHFLRMFWFFNKGRCRACFLHEDRHPTKGWAEARPLNNKRKATK